ncbi:hypothetical protein J1N35_017863 [Gossypium stocksii]|uniref:RNase H type-1 domain-containing protein n=1 Tax=Gossypium stocksii TaxID=47602 RepID=A0A9D3VMW8_9ROSI|nr:hypothetical protein J1N35_017863 [Gossypium stocksii]
MGAGPMFSPIYENGWIEKWLPRDGVTCFRLPLSLMSLWCLEELSKVDSKDGVLEDLVIIRMLMNMEIDKGVRLKRVERLENTVGRIAEVDEGVGWVACGYFSGLFTSQGWRDLIHILSGIHPHISEDMNAFLCSSLIFGEATLGGAANIKAFLNEYEGCLGQMVNYDKSLICFSLNDGDWTSISIWEASWLSSARPCQVESPMDAQKILHLPLAQHGTVDRLRWCLDRSREYSVKSAYPLLCSYPGLEEDQYNDAWAGLQTIRFVKDMGFRPVEVEGDSSVVISKFQSTSVDQSEV